MQLPADQSLRSGFLRSVAGSPDAPALVVGGNTLTYGNLDALARAWSGALLARRPGGLRRVGVYGSRSQTAYVATLTALYCGATYVPLNPRFPAARTQAMIRQAGLDAIIVDKLASAQLDSVLAGLENKPDIYEADGAHAEQLRCGTPLAAPCAVSQHDIAYLLFTSGSTGTPKGVPITHANVRAYIDWAVNRYSITAQDRFSQTFDQTFDLSIFDLFVAWERGACVHAMSPVDLLAPGKFINQNAITVWFSVPSIPAQMRKRRTLTASALPTLRWSLFCGNLCPRAVPRPGRQQHRTRRSRTFTDQLS